jgi:hypothetical protein
LRGKLQKTGFIYNGWASKASGKRSDHIREDKGLFDMFGALLRIGLSVFQALQEGCSTPATNVKERISSNY